MECTLTLFAPACPFPARYAVSFTVQPGNRERTLHACIACMWELLGLEEANGVDVVALTKEVA